ncbi:hypothetical protein GQ53DRAFT_695031 [Thozetella sp. PMI_491]|nr:hypothetical protein GQ53DRAFT_695031 [Thozetella sp. PMI_491]
MPVDHFNSSDIRTYNNRYFVNDTYYKEGGPVIFYDFGESGIDSTYAAIYFAGEANVTSAPLELAKALNGVVIGWEHRYYGYSNPFDITGGFDASGTSFRNSTQFQGIPVGGAADYKYLTVEQALEDTAYFARNFNKTKLGVNNTVLAGQNATANLGPDQTPWIWIGASYPGNRGVWARMRNPEIWYAVWASSAPVQAVPDGSAYYNSIYRAIPANCSSDIQAVANYINDIFTSDDAKTQLSVQTGTAFASGWSTTDRVDLSVELDAFNITQYLFVLPLRLVQSLGVSLTTQKFCDHMESFNGIVASQSAGAKGLSGREIGFAALLYGLREFQNDYSNIIRNASIYSEAISTWEDLHSWEWQVLSELGFVVNFNASSPLNLGTKFYGLEPVRTTISSYFGSIPEADIPRQPNQTYLQSFKGWDAQPSNVMWTNGEFDPWRAYTVMSLEQDLGAPVRKVTQDIPKCNEAPAGTDVFGLLYGGAVHAEDIAHIPGYPGGSIAEKTPVEQGADLFVSAYKAWQPCFATSRTQTPGNAGFRLRPDMGFGKGLAILIIAAICTLA